MSALGHKRTYAVHHAMSALLPESGHVHRNTRCPLWVRSRHMRCTSSCPLCPRKRQQMRQMGTSAKGQKQTTRHRFNNLISAGEYRRPNQRLHDAAGTASWPSMACCWFRLHLAFSAERRAFLEPRFGFHGFQSEEMETANDENGSIPSACRTTTRIRPKARGRRLRG